MIILILCELKKGGSFSEDLGFDHHADLRENPDREDDHPRGGAVRHHREYEGRDFGWDGTPSRRNCLVRQTKRIAGEGGKSQFIHLLASPQVKMSKW